MSKDMSGKIPGVERIKTMASITLLDCMHM